MIGHDIFSKHRLVAFGGHGYAHILENIGTRGCCLLFVCLFVCCLFIVCFISSLFVIGFMSDVCVCVSAVPRFRLAGLTEEQIEDLLVNNPRRYLTFV